MTRALKIDSVVVATIVLICFILSGASYRGLSPQTRFSYQDAYTSSAFSAYSAQPERFQNDALFSQPEIVKQYMSLQLPLLTALGNYFDDFGRAVSFLAVLQNFIFLLGFYLLGIFLFKSRYWALVSLIAIATPLRLPAGEVWGLAPDSIARVTFQSLLPFLLLILLKLSAKPGVRLWIAVALIILFYIHAVSAPVWFASAALTLASQTKWKSPKDRRDWFLGLLIIAISLIPFIRSYLGSHRHGFIESSKNTELLQTMKSHFSFIMDIPGVFFAYVHFFRGFRLSVIVLSLAAIWGLRKSKILRQKSVQDGKYLAYWIGVAFAVSALPPALEYFLSLDSNYLPTQIDLIRNLRYLVPLLLLLTFWLLSSLDYLEWDFGTLQLSRRKSRQILRASGLVFSLLWLSKINYPYFGHSLECWKLGKVVCADEEDRELNEAIRFIRDSTPKQARFFSQNKMEWVIRSAAFRPVIHSELDGGFLFYTNFNAAKDWSRMKQGFSEALATADPTQVLDYAKSAGADFALLTRSVFTDHPYVKEYPSVWESSHFIIYKLRN